MSCKTDHNMHMDKSVIGHFQITFSLCFKSSLFFSFAIKRLRVRLGLGCGELHYGIVLGLRWCFLLGYDQNSTPKLSWSPHDNYTTKYSWKETHVSNSPTSGFSTRSFMLCNYHEVPRLILEDPFSS